MAHTAPAAPFVIHRTRIGKGAMKTLKINCQSLGEFFWSSSFIFQLENPWWMLRTLRKLRKECLAGIGYGATLFRGSTKGKGENQFSFWKSRHKWRQHIFFPLWQRRKEFSSPTSKLVSKLANKKTWDALNLLWALRGWGRAKFAENLSVSPFNKDLSNDTTPHPNHAGLMKCTPEIDYCHSVCTLWLELWTHQRWKPLWFLDTHLVEQSGRTIAWSCGRILCNKNWHNLIVELNGHKKGRVPVV